GKLRSGRTAADLKAIPERFEKYADSEGAHYREWIRACKGGPKAQSAFDIAGPVTETLLLGNLAIRAGQRLEWDASAMRVLNLPSANQWVRTKYRPGFVS
ncbi:MAG: gfo/Idh/MocA family oxidoreductase, partial [Verrucomicrobiota bacterium]